MNGLFPKKNIEEEGGGGRGHGISRSIEKIKCGQEKAITGVIKKKPYGIYTFLGYWITQSLEIPGVKLHFVWNFLG